MLGVWYRVWCGVSVQVVWCVLCVVMRRVYVPVCVWCGVVWCVGCGMVCVVWCCVVPPRLLYMYVCLCMCVVCVVWCAMVCGVMSGVWGVLWCACVCGVVLCDLCGVV